MQFSAFSPDKLRQAPNVMNVGSYRVEFQAFSKPEHIKKTPVIFLGGAFQSFVSFKHEVEWVYQTHPVILIDLPSQGSNDQLAPELSLADYGHLLSDFLHSADVNNVMVVGLSYGSAMALLFATQYPQRIEKLMLSGITCFRRQSLVTLLQDSMDLLRKDDMRAYATTALCNLINHSRLQETGVSAVYRKMLYRQIVRLNDNEKRRHEQNTQRLMDFTGFDAYPTCPTLIAAGEFDNFTLPEENAAVAAQCSNAQFAIIKNADHLAQLERKEASCRLFHNFMCGQSIDNIEGTELFDPNTYRTNGCLEPRMSLPDNVYELHDDATGKVWPVRINNFGFSECDLDLQQATLGVQKGNHQLRLSIPEIGFDYHIIIAEKDQFNLRCLVVHRGVKAVEALIEYLQMQWNNIGNHVSEGVKQVKYVSYS